MTKKEALSKIGYQNKMKQLSHNHATIGKGISTSDLIISVTVYSWLRGRTHSYHNTDQCKRQNLLEEPKI